MSEPYTQRILPTLCSADIPLYAIADAAQPADVLTWLRRHPIPFSSLYGGVRQRTLGHLAPYLLTYRHEHAAHWQELIARFWSRSCLYFVSGGVAADAMRLHLKKSLQVMLPDKRVGLLRYYDPRAWLQFCRIATRAQMDTFFGDCVRAVHCEIDGGRRMMTVEIGAATVSNRLLGLPRAVEIYMHELIAPDPGNHDARRQGQRSADPHAPLRESLC